MELDEAGKLAAFRERFGRGFDLSDGPGAAGTEGGDAAAEAAAEEAAGAEQDAGMDFEDLMSGYSGRDEGSLKEAGPKKSKARRK